MAAASPVELDEFHHKKLSGQPLKLITAAGPYTLNDNLLFEPFAALMDRVNRERPDVLLLVCKLWQLTIIHQKKLDTKLLLCKHRYRSVHLCHLNTLPSFQETLT